MQRRKSMRKIKENLAILLTACLVCMSLKGMNVYASEARTVTYSKATPIAGVVTTTTSGLNVRAQPSTSSKIIATLQKQSNIMIVGESGNLGLVQYDYAGNTGYASKDYISASTNATYCLCIRGDITGNVNFRMGPGTEYQSITALASKTRFAAVSFCTNGWANGVYAISFGYVDKDLYVILPF